MRRMAAVEPRAFSPAAVMATTSRRSQPPPASSGCAAASLPSARAPRAISTKPPKIERAAEPEPRRASTDSSAGASASPAAPVAASASAANPDADDASPDAVGTLLSVTTVARAAIPARARTRSRNAVTRAATFSDGRRAVQRDPIPRAVAAVEGDAGAGAEAIERQREAAGGRQVERLVALSPVLDERDVGAGDGGGGAHRGAPAGAATMSARKPS